jgi:hypothetical protein
MKGMGDVSTARTGFSFVVRRRALRQSGRNEQELLALMEVPLFAEDAELWVLGPCFETESLSERLTSLGLTYFEDYFDIPHSGGPVPDWCEISLEVKDS